LSLLAAVVLGVDLMRFNARVPALTTADHVDEYRRVVARQMYGALFVLAMFIAAAAVMIVGTALELTSLFEWAYLVVLSGVIGVVGAWNKSVERKAKAITAEGEYARQRDEIVHVWMKRPLPNW
ncbi:MAG: hypothetical protein M3552_11585, partial [Planctomycetota bacterium]|nr:hypothetical protein [Planctomycetota bacterium]